MIGKDVYEFHVKLETSWERQQKIQKLKQLVIETNAPKSIEEVAKVYTADYFCDVRNMNNSKYKGLYKWWHRIIEKLKK